MEYLKHKEFYSKKAEVTGESLDQLILLEAAFNSLNKEDRTILTNEYLLDENWNWWMDYYSKSSFYRHKKRAIINFLTLLNSTIDVKIN